MADKVLLNMEDYYAQEAALDAVGTALDALRHDLRMKCAHMNRNGVDVTRSISVSGDRFCPVCKRTLD